MLRLRDWRKLTEWAEKASNITLQGLYLQAEILKAAPGRLTGTEKKAVKKVYDECYL